MERHEAAMEAHAAAMKVLDERIAGLVSGFGEFVRRGDGGARP